MTYESYSRVSAQKRHLKKLLNDDTIDLRKKTEVEITEQHGTFACTTAVLFYGSGLVNVYIASW